MYIPKINLQTDQGEILNFMKRFSFATIVTTKDGLPIATHLPFFVDKKEQEIILTSHFAKANEQWKTIENDKVLVIFSEPHAYVSPSNYEKKLNVPTWNYISVHAYGCGKIISKTEEVLQVLEQTIDNYELAYRAQWDSLPEKYKLGMINGIVAFKIVVKKIEGKEKLSQNKKKVEQQRIIQTLSKSEDTNEVLIAEYMKKRH